MVSLRRPSTVLYCTGQAQAWHFELNTAGSLEFMKWSESERQHCDPFVCKQTRLQNVHRSQYGNDTIELF